MAYSARQAPVVAPDKGSFPLDHGGQCKSKMQELMACLKENQGETLACRQLSRAYLECRMERGLMAQETLDSLGFDPEIDLKTASIREAQAASRGADTAKEKKGFVSGLEAKPLPLPKKD